jgi:hypothetical protein
LLAPINKQMGLPFSVTTFMWTHAATFLLLIPILAVALPTIRVVPIVYVWNVRRRLLYWYRQLRWLERSLDSGAQAYAPNAAQAELDRIGLECVASGYRTISQTSSTTCAGTSNWYVSGLWPVQCGWPRRRPPTEGSAAFETVTEFLHRGDTLIITRAPCRTERQTFSAAVVRVQPV